MGLSDEAAAEMDAKRAELSEARKARVANMPGLAITADIEGFVCSLSQPVHSPSSPGILSLAFPLGSPASPTAEPSIVATGASLSLLTPALRDDGMLIVPVFCHSLCIFQCAVS